MDAKNMSCLKCNDQRIIWTKDKFGNAKSEYCPKCNKNGNRLQKEIDKQVNKNGKSDSAE